MMINTRFLLTALALTSLAGGAQAQISVKVLGENFSVAYSDSNTGNVVGGGQVRVDTFGQDLRIVHLEQAASRRAPGLPVDLGDDKGIVYRPLPDRAIPLAAR
ncbi:hypothetical protein ACFOD4_00015 [Pseudoroseomonas globiformis]|uniref:Uncharacterized protein n=1 Tax=Teichococcus globiformis TaxID=2307229 RepID=A0ABV7FXE1_9PROT